MKKRYYDEVEAEVNKIPGVGGATFRLRPRNPLHPRLPPTKFLQVVTTELPGPQSPCP